MTNQQPEQQVSTEAEISLVARSEWTVRRVVMGTLVVVGVATVFLLLYRLYMIVFLFIAALAIQVALSPLVEWLYRWRIPRALGVLGVYATLLIAFAAVLWFGTPPAINQVTAIARDAPQYYVELREFLTEAPVSLVRRAGRLLPEEPSLPLLLELTDTEEDEEQPTTTLGAVWIGLRSFFALVAIFVLAYYWTLEGNTIIRKLILRAPAQQRDEWRTLIEEFQVKMGGYFRGTAILCVIVGVASTIAFLIIGVPQAILLGVIMGLFEALPILGPVLGAIPAIVVTLAVAPEKTLWVIVALLLIQGIEGNILVPRVMDQSVGVNAIVSLLAIAAFGALFGIAGAILAIPLAAMVQIVLWRILFNAPIRQDGRSSSTAREPASRSRVGVLRLETQEIIQDLHKDSTFHAGHPEQERAVSQAEDTLEALAVELDALLAELETDAPPDADRAREQAAPAPQPARPKRSQSGNIAI